MRRYTSVRAGWWVVCNIGGSGTFRVAVRSAVISSLWVAFLLATGRVKRVWPPATKGALAWWLPAATLTLPEMRVTEASRSAGDRLAEVAAVHRQVHLLTGLG